MDLVLNSPKLSPSLFLQKKTGRMNQLVSWFKSPKDVYAGVCEGKMISTSGDTAVAPLQIFTKEFITKCKEMQKEGKDLLYLLGIRIFITKCFQGGPNVKFITQLYDVRMKDHKRQLLASVSHTANTPQVVVTVAPSFPIHLDDVKKDIMGVGTIAYGLGMKPNYTASAYNSQIVFRFVDSTETLRLRFPSSSHAAAASDECKESEMIDAPDLSEETEITSEELERKLAGLHRRLTSKPKFGSTRGPQVPVYRPDPGSEYNSE